ncbi:MAG: hypothetical protein MZU84_09355 [Sphingobacterium sp.]|nr:hypothetical protein [Sphingobacterium sp.]
MDAADLLAGPDRQHRFVEQLKNIVVDRWASSPSEDRGGRNDLARSWEQQPDFGFVGSLNLGKMLVLDDDKEQRISRGPGRSGHWHIARLPPGRILQRFFGEAVGVGPGWSVLRALAPRPPIFELPETS